MAASAEREAFSERHGSPERLALRPVALERQAVKRPRRSQCSARAGVSSEHGAASARSTLQRSAQHGAAKRPARCSEAGICAAPAPRAPPSRGGIRAEVARHLMQPMSAPARAGHSRRFWSTISANPLDTIYQPLTNQPITRLACPRDNCPAMSGSSVPAESRHLPLFLGRFFINTPTLSLSQQRRRPFSAERRRLRRNERGLGRVTGPRATAGGRATDSRALSRH